MIGKEIHKFAKELWPINRSITGEGVRETLQKISKHLPKLSIKSVSSETQVFDWIVPNEWNVKEAYIITPSGKKICDFSLNNLHLVGYSFPFRGTVSLDELKKHLYTAPDQPNAIPYITSYYEERWGFCLSQDQFDSLENGNYKVVINSTFSKGELNYGELLIKGKSDKEIFLSTYICHPSMANNELSGIAVVTFLSKWLQEIDETNYSYRIIFIPETTLKKLERDGANMKDVKLEPSMFEDRAKVSCKLRLLLGHIVESNSLESTNEQTQAKIKEFSINYDDPEQALKWFNEDPTRLQEPKALATEDNVVEWFMGMCKIEKKSINFDKVISAKFDE